jgi:hypothetical protein
MEIYLEQLNETFADIQALEDNPSSAGEAIAKKIKECEQLVHPPFTKEKEGGGGGKRDQHCFFGGVGLGWVADVLVSLGT